MTHESSQPAEKDLKLTSQFVSFSGLMVFRFASFSSLLLFLLQISIRFWIKFRAIKSESLNRVQNMSKQTGKNLGRVRRLMALDVYPPRWSVWDLFAVLLCWVANDFYNATMSFMIAVSWVAVLRRSTAFIKIINWLHTQLKWIKVSENHAISLHCRFVCSAVLSSVLISPAIPSIGCLICQLVFRSFPPFVN